MSHQQYCIQLLEDNQIISILEQKKYSGDIQTQLFPICEQNQIPQFFLNNLVSPNRIIKYLNGQYCIYKAFYFQLFKLMFQIQNEQKDYIEIFKQVVFDPNLLKGKNDGKKSGKSSGANSRVSRMNNQNQIGNFQKEFKIHQKCILQFIEKISENQKGLQSFQDYLKLYPQVDQSMIIILETFLQNYDKQMGEIDSVQSILQYLSEILQISLVVFENCFKFQQSDVFLYIDQKQLEQIWIYIAFNQILDSAISQQPQNQQQTSQNQQLNQQNKQTIDAQFQQIGFNDRKNNIPQIDSKKQQIKYKEQNNKQINKQTNAINNGYLINTNIQNNRNLRIVSQQIPQLQRQIESDILPNQFQLNKKLSKSIEFSNLTNSVSYLGQNTSDNYGLYNNNNGNTSFHKVMKQNFNQFQIQKNKKLIQSEQIVSKNYNPNTNIVKRQQSITQPYEYQSDSLQIKGKLQYLKTSKSIENSFQVAESSLNKVEHQISHHQNPKINESRTQTIINMFGDMLKSTVNVQNQIYNSGIYESKAKQVKTINKIKQIQQDYYKMANMMKKNQTQHVILNAQPNTNNKQEKIQLNKIQITKKISEQKIQYKKQKSIKQQQNYMIDSQKNRSGQYQYGISRQSYAYPQIKKQKQNQFNQPLKYGNKSLEIDKKYYQNRNKIQSQYASKSQNIPLQVSHIKQPKIQISKPVSIQSNSSKYDKDKNNFYDKDDYFNIKQKSYDSNRSQQNKRQFLQNQNYKQLSIKSAELKKQFIQNKSLNINSPFMIQEDNTINSPFRIIEQKLNNVNNNISYNNNKYENKRQNVFSSQDPIYQKIYDKKIKQKTQLKKYTQNQEDQFFYRPNNSKFNHQSRLKTIIQLQASKETFKQQISADQKNRLQQDSSNNFINRNPITVYQRYSSIKSSFQSQKQKQKVKSQVQKQLLRSINRNTKYQDKKVKDFLQQDSFTGNNGTFYKQFTNTKILKHLKEPYRTKVEILKNRFKGQQRIENYT